MPNIPEFEVPDVKFNTPEGGAELDFRAGQHIGGVVTRAFGQLAQAGNDIVTQHIKQVTDRETLSGLAQEAQDDATAEAGLNQTAVQDIKNDVHDPTFGAQAKVLYAQALSAGVNRYSTEEGKKAYVERAASRLRWFSGRSDVAVAQAQGAQVPIDVEKAKGGILDQAAAGGLGSWSATQASIKSLHDSLGNLTSPEAAASLEEHTQKLTEDAFTQATQTEIRNSPNPSTTAEGIIGGQYSSLAAPVADRLRDYAKAVEGDAHRQQTYANQQQEQAALGRETQIGLQIKQAQAGATDANGKPIPMPTAVDIAADPAFVGRPESIGRLTTLLDKVAQPTDTDRQAFYTGGFNQVVNAARSGKPMTDPQIMAFAGRYPEEAGKLVELNKFLTHRSGDTKLSPLATKDWADTDAYIRNQLGPKHDNPGAKQAAEPAIQAALTQYGEKIFNGLQAGLDPGDLMDVTGRSANSVFKNAPLASTAAKMAATPSLTSRPTIPGTGPKTQAEAHAFFFGH